MYISQLPFPERGQVTERHISNALYDPNTGTGEIIRGDEPAYAAARILTSGNRFFERILMNRPEINDDDVQSALEQTGRNLQTIKDPRSSKQFEISIAGLATDQNSDEVLFDAEVSTMGSAISTNSANAVEFAENAAVAGNPRLYIASFGNGYSSPFDRNEVSHLKKFGTMIRVEKDGDLTHSFALPTIQALHRALRHNNLNIRRLSANSLGGSIATALMHEMPEGQVTHAYIKGRPNIINHKASVLGYNMLTKEHSLAAKQNKALSKDPWALTPELIDQASKIIDKNRSNLDGRKNNAIVSALRRINNSGAYARGDIGFGVSPALYDSRIAHKHHPNAQLTFHFSVEDELYKKQFSMLHEFITELDTHSDTPNTVQGLMVPGTHADHTYYPSVRWAAEQYAFNQ